MLISKVWMFPFVSVICINIEGLKSLFMLDVMMVTSMRHLRLNKPVRNVCQNEIGAEFEGRKLRSLFLPVKVNIPGCLMRLRRFARSSCVSRL